MNSDALTKKERNRVFLRWFFLPELCWNYETMQSAGVVITLGPTLRKIYDDDEEYKEALLSHYMFFNTQPYMGNLIMGAALAMEAQEMEDKAAKREAISALKTGLMGPFAGLGDALFFVIPLTIFNAMAAYAALEGNATMMIPGLIFGFALIPVRYWLFNLGYTQGTKFLTTLSDKLKSFTNAALILGMMVIGALMATVVTINVPFKITQGDFTMKVQDTLNMIVPNLLPAAFVMFIYWILGRKKMTSTKIIMIVLLIAFIGYNAGILV